MKRIVVLCTAVALGVAAGPASAANSGDQGGGPPSGTGGGAQVIHCNSEYYGQSGNVVFNKNGYHNNGANCNFI